MRRVSAAPVAGLPPPLPTRRAGDDLELPRTAGDPEGEAAPSIRGADPVLAGTALRTHRPKRGATVFHGHTLHVPRRSLRPALQAVDFDSVRRCGHGQLLHWLASIQLWPTPLAAFLNIMSFNCSTKGSGRPGRAATPQGNRGFRFPVVWGQPDPRGSCGLGFSIRSHRMTGPAG